MNIKHFLIDNNIEFDKPQTLSPGEKEYLILRSLNIPSEVITAINSASSQGLYYISGVRNWNKQVLKVDTLICQPSGILNWDFPDMSDTPENNFIIISANEILMNAPAQDSEMCILNLITKYTNAPFNGKAKSVRKADKGGDGLIPPDKSGQRGGSAQNHGADGYNGETYNYPTFYVFYKNT